jgi:hypothetical protein
MNIAVVVAIVIGVPMSRLGEYRERAMTVVNFCITLTLAIEHLEGRWDKATDALIKRAAAVNGWAADVEYFPNLRERDEVRRLGILHRDVKFRGRPNDVEPLRLLEHRHRRRRRLVESVGGHFD